MAALGLPELVAKIELIHGSDILSVSDPGLHGKADGLVACRQDLVLTLTVADCYPVAIVTVAEKVLLHCGWRGVAANILEKAFDRLGGRSTSRDMRVWIGPGIGPECYPVGSDVSANFPESLIEDRGTIKFDLCSEIERRLESQGLDRSQIKSSGLCTACHPEIFFSHRRDGFPSGRMAAFLW